MKEADTPPPTPDAKDDTDVRDVAKTILSDALETAVSGLATHQEPEPCTPPPSPSLATERQETMEAAYTVVKSGSTDSAVEATEEALENLEEEKENIDIARTDDIKVCKNVEPNCDIKCDSEIASDLGSTHKIEEVSDRRNLAEIKI